MDRVKNNPIVSVIVLTYNKFDNIERNLKSIQCQDYVDLEIIIHDDCSDDFPKEKIIEILSLNRTKYGYRIEQNKMNRGTVKNYNRAINIAKGDIIVPLSQDDTFFNNSCISTIVNYFQENDCCVCTGNRVGEFTGNRYPNKTDMQLLESGIDDRILLILMTHNFISGATLYLKRSAFDEKWKPLFNEDYLLLEDYPFVLKCLFNHIHIGYINKDMIIYGEKGVSTSSGRVSKKVLEDETLLFKNTIIPGLHYVRSKTVQKYIQYQYLKLKDSLMSYEGKKGKSSMVYLLKNPRVLIIIMKMMISNRLGLNRYSVLFNMEDKTRETKDYNILNKNNH